MAQAKLVQTPTEPPAVYVPAPHAPQGVAGLLSVSLVPAEHWEHDRDAPGAVYEPAGQPAHEVCELASRSEVPAGHCGQVVAPEPGWNVPSPQRAHWVATFKSVSAVPGEQDEHVRSVVAVLAVIIKDPTGQGDSAAQIRFEVEVGATSWYWAVETQVIHGEHGASDVYRHAPVDPPAGFSRAS